MNLFDLILYSTFSRVLFDETISESVKQIRYEALQQLSHILTFYKEKGYDDRLLMPIAEKKCEMILNCNSKTEMDGTIDNLRFLVDLQYAYKYSYILV